VTSRQKALFLADLARAKKAEDIVILDMRKLSNVTDFFILATASSSTRAQAISEGIKKGLLEIKEKPSSIEGLKDARWILIDAYDVVTHVFSGELRGFYNLEGLWGDAPRIKLCRRKRKKKTKPSRKTLKRR